MVFGYNAHAAGLGDLVMTLALIFDVDVISLRDYSNLSVNGFAVLSRCYAHWPDGLETRIADCPLLISGDDQA